MCPSAIAASRLASGGFATVCDDRMSSAQEYTWPSTSTTRLFPDAAAHAHSPLGHVFGSGDVFRNSFSGTRPVAR